MQYELATIPFQGTAGFVSIRDIETGEIYVSPKSICELFGVAWTGQRQKLAADAQRWDYRTIFIPFPGDNRHRELAIIPDRKVRSWVCGISPTKVREAIREQLLAFQDECDTALYNYWTKGVAVNPRHPAPSSAEGWQEMRAFLVEAIETAVRTTIREVIPLVETTAKAAVREALAEMQLPKTKAGWLEAELEAAQRVAEKLGLGGNQVLLTAVKILHQLHGETVDLSTYLPALPSSVQARLCTPTELGQQSGGLSAREVNLLLQTKGLQEKTPTGTWKVTEAGKAYAEYLDTNKRHHDGTSIQQIKWFETVLERLKEP